MTQFPVYTWCASVFKNIIVCSTGTLALAHRSVFSSTRSSGHLSLNLPKGSLDLQRLPTVSGTIYLIQQQIVGSSGARRMPLLNPVMHSTFLYGDLYGRSGYRRLPQGEGSSSMSDDVHITCAHSAGTFVKSIIRLRLLTNIIDFTPLHALDSSKFHSLLQESDYSIRWPG